MKKTPQELYEYFEFGVVYCKYCIARHVLKEQFFEAIDLGILIEICRAFDRIDYEKNKDFKL